MTTSNLSWALLSILAYHIFCILPHIYAVSLLDAHGHKVNVANPRASLVPAVVKGKVPDNVFGKYQRAEAAQNNSMEQLPLYAVAVLSSIVAQKLTATDRVGGEDVTGLNAFVAAFLAARVAYVLAYIQIANPKKGFIRSLMWVIGLGLTIYQIYKAASLLA